MIDYTYWIGKEEALDEYAHQRAVIEAAKPKPTPIAESPEERERLWALIVQASRG
jgi:hypothetical protein